MSANILTIQVVRRLADRLLGSPEIYGHEEREAEQNESRDQKKADKLLPLLLTTTSARCKVVPFSVSHVACDVPPSC